MDRIREQILDLLRCSLWGTTPSKELFEGEVQWGKLLKEAQQQAVLGQVYTQLEQIEKRPESKLMMRLHTLTTLNRTMRLKQLQALDTITKRLAAVGITRPVLLKGAGVATNYIDPGVRQCGDIDLYVGKEHYELACNEAKKWSESIIFTDSMSRKHYHFNFDGISVEIHRIAISSNNISRHASKFDAWCVESLEGDALRHEVIEGVEVYLPPYNFDAIYIFYHAWNHFCTYGIGFRQICDWSRHLAVHRDKIDRQDLEQRLDYFGLTKPWGFFAAIATTLLGLDRDAVPGYDSSKDWKLDKVGERIWDGGNFGFYGGKFAGGKGFSTLVRKFFNFFALFHSFGFLRTIDKPYAYNFLLRTPLNSIKSNIFQLYYITTGK